MEHKYHSKWVLGHFPETVQTIMTLQWLKTTKQQIQNHKYTITGALTIYHILIIIISEISNSFSHDHDSEQIEYKTFWL